MEILSLHYGLPSVDPDDDISYMHRIADLNFLQERDIHLNAAAIARAFNGK